MASNENIEWLKSRNYRYLVVSREKHKEPPKDDEGTVVVRDDPENKVTVRGEKIGTEALKH